MKSLLTRAAPMASHAARYFATSAPQISPELAKQAAKCLHGVEFQVVAAAKAHEVSMKGFVSKFFKQPIQESPSRSALGGESVSTTMTATPEHESSMFLMHFAGTQEKHFHGGPRLLNIFANEPWFLYAGGSDISVLQNDKVPLVKIAFPGNSYTQVRFAKNFIHGFEGKDFGAVSTHYTDTQELQEKAGEKAAVATKDVMTALTSEIPSSKLHVISGQAIPYQWVLKFMGIGRG